MKRALVIRVSALGDVILTEPVVRALRSANPGIEVDLVTDRRYATLMRRAGYDRVFPYEAGRPPEEPYDLVLDLQGKLRTRVLARRVEAKRRLTLRKRTPGRALLTLVGHDPPITDRHTTELYLGLLGAPDVDRAPRLRREASPDGLLIGLSPGATHATKRWPSERFGALADRLQKTRPEARFLPVGGPRDRGQLRAMTEASSARFEEGTAATDVAGLASALERLSLLISVDTGPAHLGAALGVPVVVLFGPTSPVRWGPIGPAHRTVQRPLDCAPCSNVGGPACPLPGSPHTCMEELGVDEVLDAVHSALGGAP